MALVKNITPNFESQDDVSVIEAEQIVATSPAPAAPVVDAPKKPQAVAEQTPNIEARAVATNAIAVASTTSVATLGTRHTAAMQNLQYAFSLDDVRSIGLAAPRVTVDTGGFTKDGKDLGKTLTMQILSYNPRWLVSAGIQGDEGKALVRFSYDGITIDGENDMLKDYLDQLKADGYAKAAIKTYVDLWGIVVDGSDDASDIIGETVLVQLSPQSAGQLKWFQINQGVKIARGLAKETEILKLTVERTKMGSDNFGRVAFSAA